MKRTISLVLSFTFIFSACFLNVNASNTKLPFNDVDKSAWYYDYVKYTYEQGWMNGTAAGVFSPNETTTRGMIVTILYRLNSSPEVNGDTFSDVQPGAYYADAVEWASANGIVTGYGNGLFGPNNAVTREQLAAILYRYVDYLGASSDAKADISIFSDYSAISSYAQKAMAWAVASDILAGTSETTLSPKVAATRAQVAAVLYRMNGYATKIIDLESYAGTYIATDRTNSGFGGGGKVRPLILEANGIISGGEVPYDNDSYRSKEPISVTMNEDGSIRCIISYGKFDNSGYIQDIIEYKEQYTIYPPGVYGSEYYDRVHIYFERFGGGVYNPIFYKAD